MSLSLIVGIAVGSAVGVMLILTAGVIVYRRQSQPGPAAGALGAATGIVCAPDAAGASSVPIMIGPPDGLIKPLSTVWAGPDVSRI
jgi:hypothetical protein